MRFWFVSNRWWVTRQTKTQKNGMERFFGLFMFLIQMLLTTIPCWNSVLSHQKKKGLPLITRRLGSLDNVCIKTWSEPEILLIKILSYLYPLNFASNCFSFLILNIVIIRNASCLKTNPDTEQFEQETSPKIANRVLLHLLFRMSSYRSWCLGLRFLTNGQTWNLSGPAVL